MLKTAAGADGTLTAELKKITAELDAGGNNTLGKLISEATPKPAAALDFQASYTRFATAVTDATNIIDEALESNDLTELDTTNLKALRSSINETKATFDAALKDSGLSATAANQPDKVTKESLDKLQAGLNSASSKAKIDDLLKANGGTLTTAMGKIKEEFGTGQGKLGKVIADAQVNQTLNFSQAYTNFETAINNSVDIIDKALESNDLTELDTTNLKALRSYINEMKATFDVALKDSGLSATAANQPDKVTKETLEKLKAGLNSAAELKKITDALTGTDGIKDLVDAAIKKAETVPGGQQTAPGKAALNISTKFGDLKTAITAATDAIDEKLDSGDLTQLDTSNLKALRSSINDIQSQLESTFADLGLDINSATGNLDTVKAKELQEALKTGVVESNKELGAKAKGIVTSSQTKQRQYLKLETIQRVLCIDIKQY